jgi:GrpB-like predicted nucleotidyltransferase (UPF0157 family)
MERGALPSVEESEITVVPHDPKWCRLYDQESKVVESVLRRRCAAIEHIGSTAVPDLLAKPIIDILVATVDGAPPSSGEIEALAVQSYVFLGEDGRRPGRWFWRKRGNVSFNLSLVPSRSELWRDNLVIRDYPRSHPLEVRQYAEVKRQAVEASPTSLLGYQNYKREFMQELKARALRWQRWADEGTTMKWLAAMVFLPLTLLACGSRSCELRSELVELTGRGARDCGHVVLGADPTSTDACVRESFNNHARFFAQYDRQGTDSKLVFGLAGDSSGNVTFLDWDGDPSGGSGAPPVTTGNRCEGPSVDTSTGRDAFSTPPIACSSAASLGQICGS